jgi:Fe-Mn family superoxide dismutase
VHLEFKDLPYGTNALSTVIDEETMKLHHDKHHKKYFDNLVEALKDQNTKDMTVKSDILSDLEKLPNRYKRESLRTMVVVIPIHEFFWNLMSPKPKI